MGLDINLPKARLLMGVPLLDLKAQWQQVGDDPAEFSVIPGALEVLVGPDYVPEPEG